MNYAEVLAEVKETVKRPELSNRINREINAAVSFYCLDNELPRDFVEQLVPINAQEYTQSFLLTLLTRFRKFKYIKRAGTKKFLTVVGNAEMEKDCILEDRYYIAGTTVNIAMKQLAANLDIGYYQHPPLLSEGGVNTFWLLDVAPYMVIDRACAAIFRTIGEEKSFATHRQSAAEAYIAFRKDILSAQ